MDNARIGQLYFYLLVFVLIFLKTEGLNVDITYLESAVAKGAVCLDGSAPAYHLARGFGAGINNWLLQIEGGGWCNNITSCLARKNNHLGSSKLMVKNLAFSGILSDNPQCNPDFYNWNKVKVRYCDGASFTGDVEAVNPKTNLHFRGARIFPAVVEDLLAKGMKNAQNAILSGCSAGGLTSIFHCDAFRSMLPIGTNVKCFSDAGYFINVKDISGAPHIEEYFNEIVTLHGSAKNLPPSCKLNPGLCFFPQYSVQNVLTPMFFINAAYDSWQIRNILVPGSADPNGTWNKCKLDVTNCSPAQLKIMQDYRLEFLSALKGIESTKSGGWFINSCYSHCQTEMQEFWFRNDSPRLSNTAIAKAAGDWFYDRRPFKNIDCPYPCDKTCHNSIYEPPKLEA